MEQYYKVSWSSFQVLLQWCYGRGMLLHSNLNPLRGKAKPSVRDAQIEERYRKINLHTSDSVV